MKIVRPTKVFSTKKKATSTATTSKPTQLQINIAKKILTRKMQMFVGTVLKMIMIYSSETFE